MNDAIRSHLFLHFLFHSRSKVGLLLPVLCTFVLRYFRHYCVFCFVCPARLATYLLRNSSYEFLSAFAFPFPFRAVCIARVFVSGGALWTRSTRHTHTHSRHTTASNVQNKVGLGIVGKRRPSNAPNRSRLASCQWWLTGIRRGSAHIRLFRIVWTSRRDRNIVEGRSCVCVCVRCKNKTRRTLFVASRAWCGAEEN